MNDIPVRKRSGVKPQQAAPTPDPQLEETAEDKLLNYVTDQIAKMQKYSKLGDGGMPGFYELNEALLSYNTVQCSLISMDVMAKQELHNISEDFEQWLAEKYLEARSVMNPTSLSANKWASAKELEMWIRVNYRSEYKAYADEKNAAEMKVAFLRRLLDSWDSQKLILNRLCKNIEVEAMQLGADALNVN